MGAASSRVASKATTAPARRVYPTRTPTHSSPTSPSSSAYPDTTRPKPISAHDAASIPSSAPGHLASTSPEQTTDKFNYAASLHALGPVNPASTLSNTSTFGTSNPETIEAQLYMHSPALATLRARDRLSTQMREANGQDETMVDVTTIRKILLLRDSGRNLGLEEIEQKTGVKNIVRLLDGVANAEGEK